MNILVIFIVLNVLNVIIQTVKSICTIKCGKLMASFVNALAYLYDREDIPVELLKAIYRYTLDVENEEGIKGKGGTSREHAEKLSKYFQNYANNKTFDLKCTTLKEKDVDILKIKQVVIKKNKIS